MAKHLIKIESTAHGVLGVRHAGLDQQYCEAGEQVILKWQPDAKWGLQEAHYTDSEDNITPIDLTPVKVDGRDAVVFTMPDSAIVIGATFKRFTVEDWKNYEGNEISGGTEGNVLQVGSDDKPAANPKVNVTADGDVTADRDVTAGRDVKAKRNVTADIDVTVGRYLVLKDVTTLKLCRVYIDNEVLKVEVLS